MTIWQKLWPTGSQLPGEDHRSGTLRWIAFRDQSVASVFNICTLNSVKTVTITALSSFEINNILYSAAGRLTDRHDSDDRWWYLADLCGDRSTKDDAWYLKRNNHN